jgi:hypothetical protein
MATRPTVTVLMPLLERPLQARQGGYRSGEPLGSLEEDVAYARVARRSVADLGIDLDRSTD